MKVLWCVLIVIISSEAAHREYYPWRRTQLAAVTHFPGIEEFYITEMRLQRSRSLQAEREFPSTTAEVKRIICNKILNNHSQVETEFWLNLDLGNIRHELKHKERNIYDQIFMHKSVDTMGGCFGCGTTTLDRVYVNPYVAIDGFVGDKAVQEYVFKCLARTKEDRKLVQYYVTEEYNVNMRRKKIDNIEPPSIAARFVFTQNVHDEWILLEMAEETGIVTRLSVADRSYEKLYLKYRKGHDIVNNPDDDPVCGLTDGQKLRLCVCMLNTSTITGGGVAPQFEQRYNNMLPDTQEVDPQCVLRKVLFTSSEIRKDPTVSEHSEWTISCSVTTRQKEVETFAVSRGYSLNSIFVFQITDDEKIIVDHHSHNVAVVDDPVIQVKRSSSKRIEF